MDAAIRVRLGYRPRFTTRISEGDVDDTLNITREDAFRAGRLIQWGLQPRTRPVQEDEYAELVRDYLNRPSFRELVVETADGLGLFVLDASEHGIVLAPEEDSVFLLQTRDYRPGSSRAEDRLLDGLVQVAIASTVFPRARDLDDDVERPRPPVTVDEVEEQLRALSQRFAREAKSEPDPLAEDEKAGLYEAWRVYNRRLASDPTRSERQSSLATRRIIEFALEKLRLHGCFVETSIAGQPAWQATRRYNVLVQELGASRLFEEVHRRSEAGAQEE